MSGSRSAALVGGPSLALAVGGACALAGLERDAAFVAGLTVLCAVWWVTEPVSISVTGLVPLAALPLAGVLTDKQVARSYGHHLIVLLLGGLLLSAGLEKSRAHRRLALYMVRLVGGGGRRLVLGFMLASAALSMWISNTATTLMLVPVALAVVEGEDRADLGAPLLLGIAYAASIGGLGTPIGTPPNVLFIAVLEETTGRTLSFFDWMRIGVPVSLGLLPLAWWVLTAKLPASAIAELPQPGPWRSAERRVLVIFGLTALAWITRAEPYGGWTRVLSLALGQISEGGVALPPTVGDSTIALAAAVALFVTPAGDGSSARLLDWRTAERVPWGLLLLFSGGLALAQAFKASGLSALIGTGLSGMAGLPLWLVMVVIALGVSFLTEVTSNTATSAVLLPILAAAAMQIGLAPEQLMVPAVLSASCAFMLPVATAPNAIVFATGRISGRNMARLGVYLNVLGGLLIAAVAYVILR